MPTLPIASKKDAGACCAPGCCDDGAERATDTAPVATALPNADALTATVRERYGAAARRVLDAVATASPAAASCCGPVNSCCGGAAFDGTIDPMSSNLYVKGE